VRAQQSRPSARENEGSAKNPPRGKFVEGVFYVAAEAATHKARTRDNAVEKIKRAGGTPALRKTGWRRSVRLGSAPTGYCYGNAPGRRKREQAPALHRTAERLRLECGGLPPLSRAHRWRNWKRDLGVPAEHAAVA